MKILVSNDDGIESPGIHLLAERLGELGEVTIVAPHRERSTAGHSLTLHKPVRILNVGKNKFATTGTPADCIYLGVYEVLKSKPDLIVSGINAGANLGTDVHYSGTVAAAREGALMNIPSYAVSLVELKRNAGEERPAFRYAMAAEIALNIVKETKGIKFPNHTLLNINVPNLAKEEIKGTKIARQGFRYYEPTVTRGMDPRGKAYYWVGGPYKGLKKGKTQIAILSRNHGFLSPLSPSIARMRSFTNHSCQFRNSTLIM